MTEHAKQKPGGSKSWDDFLLSAGEDVGFMQSSWWAAFLAGLGWDHFGAVLQDGADLVGGAQVLVRRSGRNQCYYYIAEGPVLPADPEEAAYVFDLILAFIERKRQADTRLVSHLRIETRWATQPAWINGFVPQRSWLEPRDTLYIDLTPSEDRILAQMKPKGRYNIRLAARHGVRTVEDFSPQGMADFIELYEQTEQRHGLQAKPRSYFQQLFQVLSIPGRGTLFFAEYRNIRLATALVIYFGDRATYLYGGSRDCHREVMAPYGLHYAIMCHAKAHGLTCYDFYGVSPPGVSDHPWARISDFKRRFGGIEKHFVATLDRVFDASAYADYRQRRRQRRNSASVTTAGSSVNEAAIM